MPGPGLCWLHVGDLHACDEDGGESVDRLERDLAGAQDDGAAPDASNEGGSKSAGRFVDAGGHERRVIGSRLGPSANGQTW